VLVAWDGRPLTPLTVESVGVIYLWIWILTQALCLMLPAFGLLFVCAALCDEKNRFIGFVSVAVNAFLLGFPIVLVLDGLVFQWIGQRLFSSSFANGMGELTRLIPFVSNGSLVLMVWVTAFSLGIPALAWALSGWLSKRISRRMRIPFIAFAGMLYSLALLCGVFNLVNANPKLADAMEYRSSAHPFFVFGLLRTPSVGPVAKSGLVHPDNLSSPGTSAVLTDQQATDAYLARERRLRICRAIPPGQTASLPDVVVVVIESLRPELLTNEVMPNLSRLAEEAIHCRSHFSGGNATNHGVFSLVTGLEPIWFGTSQRFDPGMFRWFKSLGYETGFFAGADDWDKFHMSGFIGSQLFDHYETKRRDGIASDRRAVELAAAFLSGDDAGLHEETTRKPRLAIVYLYGTHATYQSYPSDQLDQPAADNRFPFPYPARIRDAVWNRYCNSARTVDRLLKPLLRRDSIVVAVGDHGEAFLEDGTVGHGTRISRYQNMTPAVLYCPDESAQTIDQPTCHADVLPTILSFLKVQLSDPEAIDGVSLAGAFKKKLATRRFCVRNYLGEDYGLIGPWTNDSGKPFAYRFTAAIRTESATPLNGIDDLGLETDMQNLEELAAEVTKWKSQLYRNSPVTQP